MYVLRQSSNIHADLARGWSAWMGTWADSAQDAAGLAEDLRHWDDDEDEAAFVARLIEAGVIREDADRWAIYHHDGLSAYALDAETDDAAIIEGKELAERLGFASGAGVAASGHLAVIADLGAGWYVLRCDETWAEV